jgi:hypothetical protein
MDTIILAVTPGAALFRQAMDRWGRRLIPTIHGVGAMFLIGAGVYLVYHWIFAAGLF